MKVKISYDDEDINQSVRDEIKSLYNKNRRLANAIRMKQRLNADKIEEQPAPEDVKVIKKDDTEQIFDESKILNAIRKSCNRAMYHPTEEDECNIIKFVREHIGISGEITVQELHILVENALERINPESAKAYREYRDYKTDFVSILDSVYQKAQSLQYIGDVSNANTDSTLVATQRSLTCGQLSKELYQKFFLNSAERQAINEGYLYIHDLKDRLWTMNCCLADIGTILKGGFECANLWYTEPKTLDVAFDVISDVTMIMAAQQYGVDNRRIKTYLT